jgi:hypothetical protein
MRDIRYPSTPKDLLLLPELAALREATYDSGTEI